MRNVFGTIVRVLSTVVYISAVTPLFQLGLVPVALIYYFSQRYFIRTSRELTRIESTSRSPIYAMFSETIDGLQTLRAYNCEQRLTDKSNKLLDLNQRAYFLNFSANCWLGVRLELAGTLIITFTALLAVLSRTTDSSVVDGAASNSSRETFAGVAGLAISLAMNVTQSLNWSVRAVSDLESQMVSVERVKSYSNMKQEAPHVLSSDNEISSSSSSSSTSSLDVEEGNDVADRGTWPREGAIVFRNVTMRYREGLPLVLKGLSITIKPHEKVGIVGRTGAGKSSLLSVLLRLVELESGSIEIDGRDISGLGLHYLRSAMAVIPQDPVLFSGTIRSNLDPFNLYSDLELWDGVRRTLLSGCIQSLEDVVMENGSNFSVGQRQLLCIARALLSKAKIIIMDEATAAVDIETGELIRLLYVNYG